MIKTGYVYEYRADYGTQAFYFRNNLLNEETRIPFLMLVVEIDEYNTVVMHAHGNAADIRKSYWFGDYNNLEASIRKRGGTLIKYVTGVMGDMDLSQLNYIINNKDCNYYRLTKVIPEGYIK